MYCDENPDCDEASDSDEEFVNIDEEDLVEFCKEKFNSAQAETANLKINVAQERVLTLECKRLLALNQYHFYRFCLDFRRGCKNRT